MKRAAITALLSVAISIPLSIAHSQETADTTRQSETLRVFLDCQTRCDFSHFRREITFVNWVRDRRDAQLHILVTSQRTGGGGQEFFFDFIGLEEFSGRGDSLFYVSNTTNTDAEVRDGQTQTLKLGLIAYVANMPIGQQIGIVYEAPVLETQQQVQVTDDPWNLWVLEVGTSGSVSGESSRSDFDISAGVEASRTTEEWKIEFDAGGWYRRRTEELSTGSSSFSDQTWDSELLIVRSLGDHWSTGAKAEIGSSTFGNLNLGFGAGPAIEYDIFPYDESTRRQIVFLYSVSVVAYRYDEITLFDQISELRVRQELEIAARARQPWGNVNASLFVGNYLHDFSLHRLTFSGGISVRVFRGFNINANGLISRIKDQISLPREDISDEDILLRRRQIGTDFRYRLRLGFSYEFGSIYNNVVNPRMNRF